MNEETALIVEDDRRLATIFAQALQTAGFAIEKIYDGQKALQRLEEIVPTVLLLDLHLPNVSGLDILQNVRADERLNDTRVVIVTADALLASQDQLSEMANMVLVKPVSFDQLLLLTRRFRRGNN